MTTDDTAARRDPSPLEIAQVWARRVYAIAAHYERREAEDPGFGSIEAHVHGAGRQQHDAAEMAAFMAQVSIAEDLHGLTEAASSIAASLGRIAASMERRDYLDDREEFGDADYDGPRPSITDVELPP